MVPKSGKIVRSEILQSRVAALIGFLLELGDVITMVPDSLLQEFTIELNARQFRQPVDRLVLRVDVGRERDAVSYGDVLQLVVRLRVVGNELLPQISDC